MPTNLSISGEDTVTTMSGLAPNTPYEIRIRARNDEGEGEWAVPIEGTTSANQAPEAQEPIAGVSLVENGSPVTLAVSTGFADPDGDDLSYTATSNQDEVATVWVTDNGVMEIAPVTGGEATITVTASDGSLEAMQDVAVTVKSVTDPNTAPMALDDTATVKEGGHTRIPVLANDTDPDGDNLAILLVGQSRNGTTTINVNGTLTYTHDGGETTTDSVHYLVSDGALISGEATVYLMVVPVNDAPVVVGTLATQEMMVGDGALTVDVSGFFSDPDDGELAYSAESDGPGSVEVRMVGSRIEMTPAGIGTSLITVVASDGHSSATLAFTVRVSANTSVVVVTADDDYYATTVKTTGRVVIPVGTESAVHEVEYMVEGPVPAGTTTILSGTQLTATDTIQISADDNSAFATGPQAEDDGSTFPEGFRIRSPVVAVGVSPSPSGELTHCLPDDPSEDTQPVIFLYDEEASRWEALFSEKHGINDNTVVCAVARAGRRSLLLLAYTPSSDATLRALEVAPGGLNEEFSSNRTEYTSNVPRNTTTISVKAAPSDRRTRAVEVSGVGGDGSSLIVKDDTLVSGLTGGHNRVMVAVTAEDGATRKEYLAVVTTNLAPRSVGTLAARTLRVGNQLPVALGGAFVDPDGDALRYTASSSDTTVATVVVVSTGVRLTGVAVGTTNIEVVASDGSLEATQSMVVTVTQSNQAPVFPTDQVFLDLAENRPGPVRLGTVAARDDDGDDLGYSILQGDTTRFEIDSATAALAYIGDGEDFEEPPRQYVLSVVASDSGGLSDTATVQVRIVDVDERPRFPGEGFDFELPENQPGPVAIGVVVANDGDGDVLHYALTEEAELFEVDSVSGTVSYTGAGEDFETPPAQYVAGILASDSEGRSDTTTFTVTVTDVEEAPVVLAEIGPSTVQLGDTLALDVSGHFMDPDGDELVYTAVSDSPHVAKATMAGTVVVVTPLALGISAVTVSVTDPGGLSAQQTFMVTVRVSDNERARSLQLGLAGMGRTGGGRGREGSE